MKPILFSTIVLSASILASCGNTQRTVAPDYQQQWQQQQTTQQTVPQRPTRVLRATDPCIELATADSENLRAYGTATSYIEKTALNEAERDARNNLAEMIKVAVEGAAQDYEMNANSNLKNSAEAIGEVIMSQFVDEEVKNTRIIKTSIYDLSDGSIQVNVCIEMRNSQKAFEQKLDNTLSREDIIGIQYDRERFIEKMADGLKEYKERNRQ